jgi:hypothetical protein
MQPGGVNPDSWSAYWYNGRVYTNDHSSLLGIGVFRIKGLESKEGALLQGHAQPADAGQGKPVRRREVTRALGLGTGPPVGGPVRARIPRVRTHG